MTYADVKERIENLITGKYGINNTIPVGRFVPLAKEYSNEEIPNITAERKVSVRIGARTPHFPVNYRNGHGYYIHKVQVIIFYALTNAGLDMPEGNTPDHGSGDLDSIEVRRLDDIAMIENVLLHDQNNWGGTDPEIYNFQPNGEPPDIEVDETNKIVKQRMNFLVYLKTTIPANN